MQFDINTLYAKTFGYVGLPFPLGTITQPTVDALKNKLATLSDSLLGKSDVLGRAYFMPVKINSIELPNPVISIEAQKNILKTIVAGKEGTVKELISANDYQIKIVGIAINDAADNIDIEQMTALYEMYKENRMLPIICAITEVFEVSNIVIEQFKIIPIEGSVNTFGYEMNLVSDDDFAAIFSNV